MDYDKLEKAIREAEKFLTTAYRFRHYQTDLQMGESLQDMNFILLDLAHAVAELRKS